MSQVWNWLKDTIGGGGHISPSKPTQGPGGFIDRLSHGPYGGGFSGMANNLFDASTYRLGYIGALSGYDPIGDYGGPAINISTQVGLAIATEGGSAEAEFVGPSLGILEGKSGMVSEQGLSLVTDHLAQFGADVSNEAMIGRLGGAMANGQSISGADLVFYTHELSEAGFMQGGMSYDEAHASALAKYGVSPFAVYHPAVIAQYPAEFGSPWKKAWGLPW